MRNLVERHYFTHEIALDSFWLCMHQFNKFMGCLGEEGGHTGLLEIKNHFGRAAVAAAKQIQHQKCVCTCHSNIFY